MGLRLGARRAGLGVYGPEPRPAVEPLAALITWRWQVWVARCGDRARFSSVHVDQIDEASRDFQTKSVWEDEVL